MLFRSTKPDTRSGATARAETYNEQIDLDVASDSDAAGRAREASTSPDLSAIWNELMSMKDLVEGEHDRKLRRIESDLRWTMTLVGAQFITLIGSAIAVLAAG